MGHAGKKLAEIITNAKWISCTAATNSWVVMMFGERSVTGCWIKSVLLKVRLKMHSNLEFTSELSHLISLRPGNSLPNSVTVCGGVCKI